jgi:hypothetical protein
MVASRAVIVALYVSRGDGMPRRHYGDTASCVVLDRVVSRAA